MIGLVYFAAVTWAVLQSRERWMTIVWTVAGLALALGVLYVSSVIWPFEAGVLGHLVLPVGMLVSALAGIYHMREHRRTKSP